MARPFMAPPATPPEIAAILRRGFAETLKDPDFLADAGRQNLDVNAPMNGGEVDELIAELYATPEDVIDKTLAIIDTTTFR
jgi:tripartite-type tricarboxylate transporter receptor subunit TctC